MLRRLALSFCIAAVCAVVAFAQLFSVSQQQVTVTPNASAYSAGQCLGGVLPVPNAVRVAGPGGARLTGVSFVDPQHQSTANDALMLLVFTAKPTGTYTDHSNCQVAAGDAGSLAGVLSIGSSNCVQDEGPATTICTITPTLPLNVTMPVTLGTIWVVPVVVATPTYGSSATLYFNFMIEPYQGG